MDIYGINLNTAAQFQLLEQFQAYYSELSF